MDWRGFTLPRLQSRFSALLSSIILGFIWGFWHFPMYVLVPGYQISRFWGFLLFCVADSVIMTWACNNTKGSTLIATIHHWSINASFLLSSQLFSSIPSEVLNNTGNLIFFIYAIIVVVIFGPAKLSKKIDLEVNFFEK